jgi:hypothetical protein
LASWVLDDVESEELILLSGYFPLFSVIHFCKELSSIHLNFVLLFSSVLNIGRTEDISSVSVNAELFLSAYLLFLSWVLSG